jgi:hypothetical protein
MNTQALVELITDAVTDAVREALPKMVAAQLDARMAALVTPALEKVDQHVFGMQAHVQSRITDMQADFAQRAIAQADGLAASWERQVEALRGAIVDQVAQAVAAVPSHPGPAGPPGPPGADGVVRAVPAVHWQAGAQVRAGSVVMHRNGLWFANADTSAEPGSGVDGFTLMFDGQELDGFETDATGALVAVLRYASGRVTRKPTGLRQLAYLGVYDHETTYHTNDVVTASGSMWICKAADAVGLRPGTDNAARAWQLAVKCGRDGRDGRDGPQGPRGEPGPAAAPAPRTAKQKNGAAA